MKVVSLAILAALVACPEIAVAAKGMSHAATMGGAAKNKIRSACMSDIQSNCKQQMGRPSEVMACLRSHAGTLSAGCADAINH